MDGESIGFTDGEAPLEYEFWFGISRYNSAKDITMISKMLLER